MADITEEMIRRHFGPDAEIKRMIFGGWRVTTPAGGGADIEQDEITNIFGGQDVYRATVLLAEEAWGSATVFGSNDHIIAGMAHGETLGVNVIPEVRLDDDGCLAVFIAVAIFGVCSGVAYMFWSGRDSLLAGLVVTWGAMKLIGPPLERAVTRNRRLRAQPLRNALPNVNGSDRTADRREAERRGLI